MLSCVIGYFLLTISVLGLCTGSVTTCLIGLFLQILNFIFSRYQIKKMKEAHVKYLEEKEEMERKKYMQ